MKGEVKYSQLLHATDTGDKLRPDEPLGSYTEFTFTFTLDEKQFPMYMWIEHKTPRTVSRKVLHSTSMNKVTSC